MEKKIVTDFVVTSLDRDDCKQVGFSAENASPEMMQKLADYIEEKFLDSGDYFEYLRQACEKYGLERTSDEDN